MTKSSQLRKLRAFKLDKSLIHPYFNRAFMKKSAFKILLNFKLWLHEAYLLNSDFPE